MWRPTGLSYASSLSNMRFGRWQTALTWPRDGAQVSGTQHPFMRSWVPSRVPREALVRSVLYLSFDREPVLGINVYRKCCLFRDALFPGPFVKESNLCVTLLDWQKNEGLGPPCPWDRPGGSFVTI